MFKGFWKVSIFIIIFQINHLFLVHEIKFQSMKSKSKVISISMIPLRLFLVPYIVLAICFAVSFILYKNEMHNDSNCHKY